MIPLLAAPLASAAISYLAWVNPEWVGVAALLPVVWVMAGKRLNASIAIFIYYLIGSYSLPDAFTGFFQLESAGMFGVSMWLAAGVSNTLPWALAWTDSKDPKQVAARMLLVVAFVTIPPLGWVGWLNPWLASSSVVPGLGWGSVLIGLLLLIALPVLWRTGQQKVSLLIAILIVAAQSVSSLSPIPAPQDWIGITTQWGAPPKQATKEEFERLKSIAFEAEKHFLNSTKVVVMPEQIAGDWGQTTETFLHAYLDKYLEGGGTLVVGATLRDRGHIFNTATSITSEGNTDHFLARQTVPIGMWKPWAAESYDLDWLARGTTTIGGKKVAVSMCFEDFLFGLSLLSFLDERPEVLVSMANAWWSPPGHPIAVQRLHAHTLARIFNVPLVRSINLTQTDVQ